MYESTGGSAASPRETWPAPNIVRTVKTTRYLSFPTPPLSAVPLSAGPAGYLLYLFGALVTYLLTLCFVFIFRIVVSSCTGERRRTESQLMSCFSVLKDNIFIPRLYYDVNNNRDVKIKQSFI